MISEYSSSVSKNSSSVGSSSSAVCSTNQPENKIALYVGPSMNTPGAIRAATITNGKVQMYVSSNHSSATDGGGLNVHRIVDNGVNKLINENNVHASDYNRLNVDYNVNDTVVVENESDFVECDTIPATVPAVVSSVPVSVSTPVNIVSGEIGSEVPVPEPRVNSNSSKSSSNNISSNPYEKAYRNMSRRYSKESAMNVCEQIETACFADWSEYGNDSAYFSFAQCACISIAAFDVNVYDSKEYLSGVEVGFRAVTENVPRNYDEALRHPLWGQPARVEWNTIASTNAIVQIDKSVAIDCIKNKNADLVMLFPVYEVKVKDGVTVYKVRLVGDGRTQYHAGSTYAATPSREELLVLLHIAASLGWCYAHVDEIRAFLNAPYTGKNRVFTKLRGNDKYYEIKGALYGLKTSPKDYQNVVHARLTELGYKRLSMCSSIFIYTCDNKIIIIYDWVDDFIFFGNDRIYTASRITEMRSKTATTEPVWDSEDMLGMQISRSYKNKTICVTMSKKIIEVHNKFNSSKLINHKVNVPMPTSGFVMKEEQFDKLPENKQLFLDKKGIELYMSVVGSLIWIMGVRLDILFTVMYLAWSTKGPRQHHLDMALYCVEYLYQSKEIPLVLGGDSVLKITAYTDASLGTAPKGRSVIGHMIKLNKNSGAIYAKTTATQGVHLSSFEAELDGVSATLKSVNRVKNILTELRQVFDCIADVYSDNKAMIDFVHGDGIAKGVRHMELRMWFIREMYSYGNIVLEYMAGVDIPADKLTKLSNRTALRKFRCDILGLSLLPEYESMFDCDDDIEFDEE